MFVFGGARDFGDNPGIARYVRRLRSGARGSPEVIHVAGRQAGVMKVLIVDDSASFRAAARSMLELRAFAVVAEAVDGPDALEKVGEFRPDVVLLDIQLPGMDGIEVAEKLSLLDDPPVMVLTSSRSARDYGLRLLMAPARGFIAKEEISAALLEKLVHPG
jgi:CheY-like chemotaxis protein